MDKFGLEQLRIVLVSALSPILAYFTPTKNFIIALVVAFAFNIWSGMRADGVVISTCKNFSFSKFKNAIAEFLLYLILVEVVFTILTQCGDNGAAMIAIKSLSYVFMYVYLQNALKNLIKVYPKNIALRIIYHIVRLEINRALPSYWQPILKRLNDELDEKVLHEKDLCENKKDDTE